MPFWIGTPRLAGMQLALIGALISFSVSSPATLRAEEKTPASELPAKPAPVPEALPHEPEDSVPFEPGVDPKAEPFRIFAAIEWAWANSDAESLLAHFGEGKVSLSFNKGGPRGGLFTRTQAAYLLSDLLKYSATETFTFEKYRNIDRDGQRPYAVADRRFRLDGILYHDQVYVELRREDVAWRVAEIKSIDR